MTRAFHPSVCPGCQQIRMRREYCTNAKGERYPNCRYCGNNNYSGTTIRECATCGVPKQLGAHFVLVRPVVNGKRSIGEYTADCRECRNAAKAKQRQMSESQTARHAKRIKPQKPTPLPAPAPAPRATTWFDLGADCRPRW